jgi:hypothetical protein
VTTYAWPSAIIPSSTQLQYRSGVTPFVSRSGAIQKSQLVDLWRLVMTLDLRMTTERATLQAFALKLAAGDHNFTVRDFSYVRRGSGAGTPLINGAGQTGTSIVTDGWTASASGVLLEGDLIQIRNQLVMVLADVNANGSGQATISVRPAVRIAPADNASIVTAQPTGTFKLLNPEIGWQQSGGTVLSDFVFECVEDVLA